MPKVLVSQLLAAHVEVCALLRDAWAEHNASSFIHVA
jgi:hypothetical protein